MKKLLITALAVVFANSSFAAANAEMQQTIRQLEQKSKELQKQIANLQKKVASANTEPTRAPRTQKETAKQKRASAVGSRRNREPAKPFHESHIVVHTIDSHPESIGFYPTALLANGQVITYIAGTPVVTSPYLGARPAFDGSDYIVNISSINRDIRLMQQRRRLYRAYESIGYPAPNVPIIAISGKSEPIGSISRSFFNKQSGDFNLGSSELDVAAALNDKVEAYIGIAYDDSPPLLGGQRVANSSFNLSSGFVNIGDLDETPFYFTAGQLYVPFGRFSSSMISSPLPLQLARTKARPFIFGYKSQGDSGPFAAVYVFKSDTILGRSGVGGFNWGYVISQGDTTGEIGASVISAINDSAGMQNSGSPPNTTFGGFSSVTNGSEFVHKIPAVDVHANFSFDRYTLSAEWAGVTKSFYAQDLSFNNRGAKPQSAMVEGGVTFKAFDRPASLAAGYQWARDTLALNIPHQRISAVFNISIWKDTVESLEYRHDIDYSSTDFANGIAPPGVVNLNTLGTGHKADALVAQIGVYF